MSADIDVIRPEVLPRALRDARAAGRRAFGRKDRVTPAPDLGHGRRAGADGLVDRRHRTAPSIAFGGSFVDDGFARFAKVTILLSARGRAAAEPGLPRAARTSCGSSIRSSSRSALLGMMVMVSAGDLIALYMGLELQSLAALRAGRDPPRQRALDRGGAQVLRPGRAVLGPPALRRLADLRLRRHDRLRRDHRGRRRTARRSGCSSGSCSSSRASPSRSRPRPSTCGRPTSTRARRRRSPPSSPPRPRSRRSALFARVVLRRLRR